MNLLGKITFIISCVFIFNVGYGQQKELQTTALHEKLSCKTGEVMVVSKELIKNVQVRIIESFEVKSGFTKFTHQKGTTYPLRRTKKGYHLYYAQHKLTAGNYWGIGINEDDPDDVIPVLVNPNGDIDKMKKYKIQKKIEYVETFQTCSACYRAEFVYLGLDENQLTFSYKEFIGVLDKLSFEEELTVPLKEGLTIDHKGMKLKIHKASKESISYELLKAFNSLN